MGSLAGPMPCDYSNLPTISDDVFLRSSTWALALGDPAAGGLRANRRAQGSATAGTSGSICTLARGGCGAGRREAFSLATGVDKPATPIRRGRPLMRTSAETGEPLGQRSADGVSDDGWKT